MKSYIRFTCKFSCFWNW